MIGKMITIKVMRANLKIDSETGGPGPLPECSVRIVYGTKEVSTSSKSQNAAPQWNEFFTL
jgi:hypothetical protein